MTEDKTHRHRARAVAEGLDEVAEVGEIDRLPKLGGHDGRVVRADERDLAARGEEAHRTREAESADAALDTNASRIASCDAPLLRCCVESRGTFRDDADDVAVATQPAHLLRGHAVFADDDDDALEALGEKIFYGDAFQRGS